MDGLLVTIDTTKLANLDKVSYFDLPKMKDSNKETIKIMFKVAPDNGIGFDVINIKTKYLGQELKLKTAIPEHYLMFSISANEIILVDDTEPTNVLTPVSKPELARYFD